MSRTRLGTAAALGIVAGVLAATSFAAPAIGGPSLGTVYGVAKRALAAGKGADGRAKRARSVADRALESARRALAEGVSTGGLRTVDGPVNPVPALNAGRSVAFCPAGSKVVSGGGYAVTPGADGMTASLASTDRAAWVVIGGNTSLRDGTVQAIAYCAPTGQAGSARTDRRAALAEAARLEQKLRAGLRER